MDLQQIDQIARREMEHRREKQHQAREPGWLYFHGLRTARIAAELASTIGANVNGDVMFAGALFHDIGKGAEHHNERGCEAVKTLLAELASSAEIEEICEIIRLHNQRQKSADQPLAARLVQDADLLDHVGPVGAWLAFYWSGAHGETVRQHVDFITGQENQEYRNGMRDGLNFDVSRKMFDERIRWEDRFFSTFAKTYTEGVWHDE